MPEDKTFKAGEDLSDYQYHFVVLDADNQVVAAGANGRTIGILQNAPGDGEAARVRLPGNISKLIVAETVAIAKLITSDANAEGEVVDTAGEWCGAIALQTGSSTNVRIDALITAFTAHASDA